MVSKQAYDGNYFVGKVSLLKVRSYTSMCPNFQKGIFSCKIMMIKCLLLITCHSAILYGKSMEFGIQEGVLACWLPNFIYFLYKMTE